jgi:hypothetical protein
MTATQGESQVSSPQSRIDAAGVGAWTIGIGLSVFAAAGLVNLDWRIYQGVLFGAVLVAGVGLVLTVYGIARRVGLQGTGPMLLGLGLACGLVNALLNIDQSLTISALALLTIGIPAVVRTVASRTALLGVSGLFAAVGVSGIGTSVTAVVVRRSLIVDVWLDVTLNVAILLGVLVAAASAGMVLAGHASTGRHMEGLAATPTGDGPQQVVEPSVATAAAQSGQRPTVDRDRLTRNQRLTLIVGFAGTVIAALISVAGSVIAAR